MKRASSVLFGAIFVMNIANTFGEISHRTIRVDDLDIFYRESGSKDGPTILLIRKRETAIKVIDAALSIWAAY